MPPGLASKNSREGITQRDAVEDVKAIVKYMLCCTHGLPFITEVTKLNDLLVKLDAHCDKLLEDQE